MHYYYFLYMYNTSHISAAIPEPLRSDNLQGILLYIDKFLKSENTNFRHIALWTLVQLLKGMSFFILNLCLLSSTKESI